MVAPPWRSRRCCWRVVYAALASGLVRDGISPVVAVVVSLLMAAIGCIHFLVRPHIFTIALVYLTFRVCQKQHERGGWFVAWVPVFTVILANLHGGFLALPVIVATAAFGHAISGPWDEDGGETCEVHPGSGRVLPGGAG